MPGSSKVAFVFPGQGSQEVGMGLQLYNHYPTAKDIYDSADRTLGFSFSTLCFNGPEEELTQTVNVQPAILTASVACLEVARKIAGHDFPNPLFVAGHSVGEYAALVASNILTFEEALSLVRIRGKLMQDAGQNNPGAMIALIGADESTANDICARSNTEISNINSPGQIVISGSKENIIQARMEAESKGIRRIVALKVSGAFHSRLMQSAADGLGAALQDVHFKKPSAFLVSNVTGNPLSDSDNIASELSTQVIKCVQWQKSVESMIAGGINIFIEFGHGQIITNIIKRINTSVKVYNVGDIETEIQINGIISEMKSVP